MNLKIIYEDKDLLFEKLSSLNFSLFPIHKVGTKSALIISKSTEFSPNYTDLKDSKFITDVSEYLSAKKRTIYLYNFGENLSPYLKTLKEFKVLNYQSGNISGLQKIVETGRFPVLKTLENEVSIPFSNIKITKTAEVVNSGAPDHLLRLFSYNKIIQESGRKYEIKIMSEDEYILSLRHKLVEEAIEVRDAKVDNLLTELADIYEVIDAIIDIYGFDKQEIISIQSTRRGARGAFKGRINLIWSEK